MKNLCQSVMAGDEDFSTVSRQITYDFSNRHTGGMSAGVFIIAQVKFEIQSGDWRKLIFLAKIDQQQSVSYSYEVTQEGKKVAKLEDLTQSLSESKAAVQKSALIDPTDAFVWDVLAYDKSAKPFLTDYFQAFLGVVERDSNSNLTRIANNTVRKWVRQALRDHADDIPEGENKNTYSARATDYLLNNDTFNTENFVNTVIKDTDPERKARLSASLHDALSVVV